MLAQLLHRLQQHSPTISLIYTTHRMQTTLHLRIDPHHHSRAPNRITPQVGHLVDHPLRIQRTVNTFSILQQTRKRLAIIIQNCRPTMSKVRFSRLRGLLQHPCNHPVITRIKPLGCNNLQNHRHLPRRPQRLKEQRMRTLISLPALSLRPRPCYARRWNHQRLAFRHRPLHSLDNQPLLPFLIDPAGLQLDVAIALRSLLTL